MAQILVRDLDKKTVDRLKRLARMNGRSLQAQVKMIVEQAAEEPKVDKKTAIKMLAEFRKRFEGREFSDSAELIREGRDR